MNLYPRYNLWIFLVLFFLFSQLAFAQTEAKTHHLEIKKIDNVWKVVEANDTTNTRIAVKPGDRISWKPEKTDVSFQFMNKNFAGVFTKALKSGKTFEIKIPARFPKGEYPYAVFCLADNVFAIGGSPPVIIVE